MCLPLLASLTYFVLLSDSPAGKVIYGATKVFTLVWPIVCVVWIWREKDRLCFQISNADHRKALPLGILSGLVIAGAMMSLLQIPAVAQVLKESAPAVKAKADALGFAEYFILFAIFLSVFHSLIEEYYWRWFVFGNLRRVIAKVPLAHLLAAISFAAHHLVITAQFFPFWFALILTSFVGVG
jgi:membrane protease YdiL (CAAX protease family)